MMGLLDLSRAFYYAVSLQGAAREGARHGAWFNTASRANNYLDDADVMQAVNQSLSGAGLTGVQVTNAGSAPSFSVLLEGIDGHLYRKTYSFDSYRIRASDR